MISEPQTAACILMILAPVAQTLSTGENAIQWKTANK